MRVKMLTSANSSPGVFLVDLCHVITHAVQRVQSVSVWGKKSHTQAVFMRKKTGRLALIKVLHLSTRPSFETWSKRLLITPTYDTAVGLETYLFKKWWPLKSNVHLWRHLGRLYIQGPSSAGTAASSLVAHQTTSIHQHKSAQRGANCIRRPSPFLSGQRVCVCVRWGVQGRGKKTGLARSVGCLRSRGGRVWRCVVGAGQAHKPSGRRPLCHLCSCWQRLQPPFTHTQTHTNTWDTTGSLPLDHNKQHLEFTHVVSLLVTRLLDTCLTFALSVVYLLYCVLYFTVHRWVVVGKSKPSERGNLKGEWLPSSNKLDVFRACSREKALWLRK